MATFVKAQASSFISTAVDYLITFVCDHFFHLKFIYSNLTGTISGGITNFLLGRIWVFHARQKKAPGQALKYLLVWIGNLLLNNGGVFLFVHYLKVDNYISKTIVSLIVGFSYNYFMQKKFVFA